MAASGSYLSPMSVTVFISHSHEDNALCEPLLTALDAWGVDYWFDRTAMRAGDPITPTILDAITARDYFIRVVTAAVRRRPEWVNRETTHFLGLLAQERVSGSNTQRRLINLVLEPGYDDPRFSESKAIKAFEGPQKSWLDELRKALGLEIGVPRQAPPHMPSDVPSALTETGLMTPSESEKLLEQAAKVLATAEVQITAKADSEQKVPTRLLTRDGLPSYAFLVVVDTPRQHKFELPVGETTIRRSSDDGTHVIALNDEFVSRGAQSVVTRAADDTCIIHDGDGRSHSSNVTRVNGKPVTSNGTYLEDGDLIQVGRTILKFTR